MSVSQKSVASAGLAVDGGPPVRTKPLVQDFPGAAMIGEEEKRLVMEVLDRKSLFRYYGPDPAFMVERFEKELAQAVGCRHALAVSSGTAALVVALRAVGIGPGDEVILPAYTFLASAGAVFACGATPVFAEVDETLNLDPQDAAARITPRTRAVMPVHFGGVPARMDEILALAARHGLAVVEDCAQSAGGRYRGRALGSLGLVGCFSFQLNKIITTGEGGAVTTNDGWIFERASRAHDQGLRRKGGLAEMDDSPDTFLAENYRMNELSGAVGLAQVRKLKAIVGRMRHNKRRIEDAIAGLPGLRLRDNPDREGDASATLTFFLPSAERAAAFVRALRGEGIGCSIPYDGKPVYANSQIANLRTHYQRTFTTTGTQQYGPGLCPRTEELGRRAVFVPMHPAHTDEDVGDIIAGIEKVAVALERRR